MALVNRKVSLNKKNLAQAIADSRYDSKYFEHKDALLKSISLKRDMFQYSY